KGAGLQALLTRHGAVVGFRTTAGRAAVEPLRLVSLPVCRRVLQLSGPPRLQGKVLSGVAAAVSRLPRRIQAAADPGRHLGTRRRRISEDPAQAMISAVLAAAVTLTVPTFGTVSLYQPASPSDVVLLVSGDAGVTDEVTAIAEQLRGGGALVIAIDLR